MKNKLGKRVLTMVLAMVLTFASSVTAFAQMGTDGDWFVERTEFYTVFKTATTNDAGQEKVDVEMTTKNDATNLNTNLKEVLAKDYFVKESFVEFDASCGVISKENLGTLATKEARIAIESNYENGSAYLAINKVTNSDADFDGTIKIGQIDSVTNKLTAAGYAGNSVQFQIAGSGRLPGVSNIQLFVNTDGEEKDDIDKGEAYLYYYDETTDSFEFVSDATWFNYWGEELRYDTENDNAINKGAYVFTTDKIADVAVKKVDVTLTSDSKFSTNDYVGKAMEVSTKAGKWYFPSVSAAIDFDPSFEVGKKLEDVSKKLATVTLPATLKYVTLDFAFSGELPGTANVTVDLSSAGFTEGQTVYLYYYNPDKNIFELTSEAAYKNGSATFTMTHCSEYIVTNEKLLTDLTSNTDKPDDETNANPLNEKLPTDLTSNTVKTGDATNAIPFVIALICGCAAIGVVVVRRRTVK